MRRHDAARATLVAFVAALVAALAAAPATAHDLEGTTAVVMLRPDGSFWVEIEADLDALLLGAGPGHDSSALVERIATLPEAEIEERLSRLRSLFQRRVRLRFDGEPAPFEVSFPDRRHAPSADEGEPPAPYLGLRARLGGRAPADWRAVTFFASRAFQQVRLTVADVASGRTARHDLEAGEESPPFARDPAGSASPSR
jgi:hypothetical protein